jgi:hypothetical protein
LATHQAIFTQDSDYFSLPWNQAEAGIVWRRSKGRSRMLEALEHGMNTSSFTGDPIYVESKVWPILEIRTA